MSKVHFTSQGCSANLREAELMAGLLQRDGHEVSHHKNHADVHIVNICTVKKDSTPLHAIKKIKQENPSSKIVVTGCVTPTIVPKIQEIDSSISFCNTHNFGKIATVVNESLEGQQLQLLDKTYELKVDLPSVRKNPIIGIIPILNGCNYFCTFCSTKLVKGKLMSYPASAIKNDMKRHLADGCKEIWITSNDTGAYGAEHREQQLVPLLKDLLSVPQEFRMRIGMMNPGNTLTILDELIEIYKHPKMFKFLHIPLQAGNNDVLKAMNRQYTVEEFMRVVHTFRKAIPNITLSTDIIVGFPGETEEQFQDTLALVKEVKFDVVNLSRYSPREGTIAAKQKQIPSWIVKERSRKLTKAQEAISLEKNKTWVGWKGDVLIDEVGKNNTMVGRNDYYKPIVIKNKCQLGDQISVTVKQFTTYDLRE